MTLNPTQLSLRHLRSEGWPLVDVVEKWNAHTRRHNDLWGIADIVAVGPRGVLAVQTTTASNVSARLRKIADAPSLPHLREAGVAIHVHGWAQKRKGARWELKREVDVS